MLQVCWRFGPLLVMMIAAMPFYLMFKRPRFDFDWTTFGALVFTQLMNFALSYAFVFLAFYTVLSHVGMITHLGGCFLLMHTMMTCAKTHHLEKAGLLLALVGFIVMVLDPNAIKDGEKVNVWIDLLALLVNFLWIGFFLGSEYVKTRMEIDTIAILGTPMMFVIGMVLSLTIEGTSFDASNDGIFGFLRPENAHVCFVWNAIFSAGFAMYGYMYALNFYSTVFVMNFLLIEPIGAQIFGVMLGIDVWPGWMTWVGAGICVVSINVIHQGEIRRD